MTHPDIAQAVATAHRDDLLRAASGRTHVIRSHDRRRRLVAWLDAQRLSHRRASAGRTTCAVTR